MAVAQHCTALRLIWKPSSGYVALIVHPMFSFSEFYRSKVFEKNPFPSGYHRHNSDPFRFTSAEQFTLGPREKQLVKYISLNRTIKRTCPVRAREELDKWKETVYENPAACALDS